MSGGIWILLSLFASLLYSDGTSVESTTSEPNEVKTDESGEFFVVELPKNTHRKSFFARPFSAEDEEDDHDGTTETFVVDENVWLDTIKLHLLTSPESDSYALSELENLLKDPNFDEDKKTVVFATGWNTTLDDEAHTVMAKAYRCRGDTNYLALDVGDLLSTMYIVSAMNTYHIGKFLAETLTSVMNGTTVEHLHLMGAGMGADIMGSAARHYHTLTKELLPRVTGFNPAVDFAVEGFPLEMLTASDAQLVDIIDTGYIGEREDGKRGTVNVIVNGESKDEDTWKYFAETVYPKNEENFIMKKCDSKEEWLEDGCDGSASPMGYAMPLDLSGEFTVKVNAEQPYGPDATDSFESFDSSCGDAEAR